MRNHLGADELIPVEQTLQNPDQGKRKIDREVRRQAYVILPGWQNNKVTHQRGHVGISDVEGFKSKSTSTLKQSLGGNVERAVAVVQGVQRLSSKEKPETPSWRHETNVSSQQKMVRYVMTNCPSVSSLTSLGNNHHAGTTPCRTSPQLR